MKAVTAAVVLCFGWLAAAVVGSGAAAGCQSAPVASVQVQQIVQLARQSLNRNAPFAANVTSVFLACKQAINGGFNYNVSFNATNTTCSPETKDWSGCCLRGAPTSCNASATCGAQGCVLKNLKCNPVTAPRPGCTGCIVAQRNLTAYSGELRNAMRIFAQQNSGVNLATVKLVEVSTQVVSGMNYYFLVTVRIQNTIQVCSLVLYTQEWTNTTTLTRKACNICKRQ